MGTVHRGERLGLGRPVAIKFLHASVARDPILARRFEVEARAMSRLSHPNCVSIIDFGVDGLPYLVMDLVDGVPLRTLLDQGRLAPARAISIARQVLAGLGCAHGHGIIHRDIKPENILVEQTAGPEDHVCILDFGLAKFLDDGSKLTVGLCVGTPHYMAPEQMVEGPVDERVDIYTTGIVLYEMLTEKAVRRSGNRRSFHPAAGHGSPQLSVDGAGCAALGGTGGDRPPRAREVTGSAFLVGPRNEGRTPQSGRWWRSG